MARRPEVRYINTYVSGSMAYQYETKPARKKKKVKLPKPRQEQKIVISVNPVAIMGIAVAAVFLIMMVVGLFRLQAATAEAAALESYVTAQQEKNRQLRDTYAQGHDLEESEEIARAMGMVPMSQVQHISTELTIPEKPAEPTAWENFWAFLTGLFA